MSFNHGVTAKEKPTNTTSQRSLNPTIPVVFVTAPKGSAHVPRLVRSRSEAVNNFGYMDDFNLFTVSEFIDSHFTLYKQSEAIIINIADPQTCKKSRTSTIDLLKPVTTLDYIYYPNTGSVKLKKASTTYTQWKDFSADLNSEGKLVITILNGSAITLPALGLSLEFEYIDAEGVKSADLIGSYDPTTGLRKGLELLDTIFPNWGVVPSLVIAPKFSSDTLVQAAMLAKSQNINGLFKAMTIVDISGSINTIEDAIEVKPLGDPGQIVCWPKVMVMGKLHHMSTHLAGIICKMDSENDGVPSKSPSNRSLKGYFGMSNNKPIDLGPSEANKLNAVGIVTLLNFAGEPRSWGNRTSAFPDAVDMKDTFIHAKRMMYWVNNWLVTETWKHVDSEITKRWVQMILSMHKLRLNGLISMGALLGGDCIYDPGNNHSISEGIVRFGVILGIPGIAEKIEFEIQLDPSYILEFAGDFN